jgi:serine/threonine protein kinase
MKIEWHEPLLKVDRIYQTDGFGPHRIERVIASGGMGWVYQTVREMGGSRSGRRYAAKTVRRELNERREILDLFNKEADVMIQHDHENILSTHGLFYTVETDPPIPLIFMDLLKGYTLRSFMDASDEIEPWVICFVAHGVLSALQHIHPLGIIHRDIKPENIFIQDTLKGQRIRLTDFGVVKQLRVAATPEEHGRYLGTDGFSPPEQILGTTSVGERSDLYALSCVLYEMFASRPVFPGLVESRDIRNAHLNQKPTPLHLLAPNAPRELVDMVMHGLAKKPEERPDNARVFAAPFAHFWMATARNASNATMSNMIHRNIGDLNSPSPGAPGRPSSLPLHTVRMNVLPPRQAIPAPATTAPSDPPAEAVHDGRTVTQPEPSTVLSDRTLRVPDASGIRVPDGHESRPLELALPAGHDWTRESAEAERRAMPLSSLAWGAGASPVSRLSAGSAAQGEATPVPSRDSSEPSASVASPRGVVTMQAGAARVPGSRSLQARASTTDPSTRAVVPSSHDGSRSPQVVPRSFRVRVARVATFGLVTLGVVGGGLIVTRRPPSASVAAMPEARATATLSVTPTQTLAPLPSAAPTPSAAPAGATAPIIVPAGPVVAGGLSSKPASTAPRAPSAAVSAAHTPQPHARPAAPPTTAPAPAHSSFVPDFDLFIPPEPTANPKSPGPTKPGPGF